MKILAVSDQVIERLYELSTSGQFSGIDLILGCGDLPYTYLENLLTLLNKPLLYVPGNHDPAYSANDPRSQAEGASNLDRKVIHHKGILIGGLGGSIRYRPDGVNQYSQIESRQRALKLLPQLMLNRIRHGRALDILITHSPPFKIHDDDTQAHQGLKAINWLIKTAKPAYHFHGHTHFYKQNLASSISTLGRTQIINVYPYKVIEIKNV
jgi:Icc-related predicted phosphoesterase